MPRKKAKIRSTLIHKQGIFHHQSTWALTKEKMSITIVNVGNKLSPIFFNWSGVLINVITGFRSVLQVIS